MEARCRQKEKRVMWNCVKKISIAFVGIVAIAGCKTDWCPKISGGESDANMSAVVIGMERSKFAGNCPGAQLDSSRMNDLLRRYTPNVVLLQNEAATRTAVVMAMEAAIAKGTLCVIYYSGHGGSQPFFDTGSDEKDGSDEFLCLYDTYLRDNDIWKIISKSKGRVFMISDSCHSQTQFRMPSFTIKPPLAFDHTLNEQQKFSMLCWSGCPDESVSYGSQSGGQFTNALLRHFTKDKTYQQLWDEIKADKTLRQHENPQSTVLGNGFDGVKFLR